MGPFSAKLGPKSRSPPAEISLALGPSLRVARPLPLSLLPTHRHPPDTPLLSPFFNPIFFTSGNLLPPFFIFSFLLSFSCIFCCYLRNRPPPPWHETVRVKRGPHRCGHRRDGVLRERRRGHAHNFIFDEADHQSHALPPPPFEKGISNHNPMSERQTYYSSKSSTNTNTYELEGALASPLVSLLSSSEPKPAPEILTMVMSRALYSAVLLLALAGPVYSTPEIPTEFFDAQHAAAAEGRFAARRVHYEESFRAWMAEHGVTFGTKGEFERRLRIFAENRCGNLRVGIAVSRVSVYISQRESLHSSVFCFSHIERHIVCRHAV